MGRMVARCGTVHPPWPPTRTSPRTSAASRGSSWTRASDGRGPRLEELLAPDLVEIGSSGRRWDREGIIAALADEERAAVRIEEFAVRLMGPAVALVTYRSVQESGAGSPAIALRSSIWRRDDAGWRLAFHQATRVP